MWILLAGLIGIVVGMAAMLFVIGICSNAARADYELEIATLKDEAERLKSDGQTP